MPEAGDVISQEKTPGFRPASSFRVGIERIDQYVAFRLVLLTVA